MKDAYWFPHDCNAMNDPKIIILIGEMGMEGYGVYWALIEHLREQPDYSSTTLILKGLSGRMQTSEAKIKQVIGNYGLFDFDNDRFTSPSLQRRMIPYDRKKEQAREAVMTRWDRQKQLKQGTDTDVIQSNNGRNTIRGDKSIEDKRRKEKRRVFEPPQIEEIETYFLEKESDKGNALKFFNFYESKGWLVGKTKMKKWRAAASNWIARDKPQELTDFSKL